MKKWPWKSLRSRSQCDSNRKELAMGHTGQELSHAQDIKYDEAEFSGKLFA